MGGMGSTGWVRREVQYSLLNTHVSTQTNLSNTNSEKYKYFPETVEMNKKRRNQRRLLETCQISCKHTVHPLGKFTGKPNLHHCDSQTVLPWECLEETMVFSICGHKMTRLFCSWNSFSVQKFKDFSLTQKASLAMKIFQ